MTLRSIARATALALFAVLFVVGAVKAIDLTTDMGGFSGGQITGLRDTFVDQLNTETIAGAKTFSGTTVISGTTTLSGATTVSGTFDATSTFSLNGTAVSATAAELDDVTLQIIIGDMASAATWWVVSPWGGTVTDWYCVLGAPISADVVLTLNVNGTQANGTSGEQLTVTAASSAAGDIDSGTVDSTTITNRQTISIGSDGGNTENEEEVCTIVIDR